MLPPSQQSAPARERRLAWWFLPGPVVLFLLPGLVQLPEAANGESNDPFQGDPVKVHVVMGKWGAVINWPVNAVHMSLLPTGKVLLWPRGALSKPVGPKGEAAPEAICYPRLWDPATNKFTVPPRPPYNIFAAATAC
jgi:hypothetical protein